MGGAGFYPAGLGMAGLDPVATPDAPRNVTLPVALWWDAASKDFLTDDNGRFLSLHPVDQKVALALTLRQGSIPGAPTMGARFNKLKFAGGPTLQKEVEDIVSLALADLLNNKDITVDSVVAVGVSGAPVYGGVYANITYTNLRTGQQLPAQLAST